MWLAITGAVGIAVGKFLKFRLSRWDQQAKRITELEGQVAQLQVELRELVDLKVENALLRAERDELRAQLGGRRRDD